MKAALFLIMSVIVATSACKRNSVDSQVIGSWYYDPSIDDQSGITYSADHIFTIWSEEEGRRHEMIFGTWRIEGTQVVMNFKESVLSRQEVEELHQNFAPFQRSDSIAMIRSLKRAR
jgi:hypothetical protein